MGKNNAAKKLVNKYSTKYIDKTESEYNIKTVPTYEDILQRMVESLDYEASRIEEAKAEMEKHQESYHRYVDAQREFKSREDHVKRLFGILGIHRFLERTQEERWNKVLNRSDAAQSFALQPLPLWEAIKEYLLIIETASASEIINFLETVDIKVSHQAIESAVKQHPEVFKTRKVGRERLISLKE